jgi:hypothetical protein
VLEGKPGLADRCSIGPVAENRGVLAVEGCLGRQFINPLQQCIAPDRWLITAAFSARLIDRLGDGYLVLFQLLESLLEFGVSV